MKIFIAGASGAIGLPLIAELIRQGHAVTGMTSSEARSRKIIEQGAAVEIANAFDAPAVERALRRAGPEIVIDQLTALPKDPADLHRYLPGDTKLRLGVAYSLTGAGLGPDPSGAAER
jgi:2-alkyl-3-oxoalkanoate reductase